MDCADILDALLLWTPQKVAKERLCRERSTELHGAILALRTRLQNTRIDKPENLSGHMAAAVGRGYLKCAVDLGAQAIEHDGLSSFVDQLVWNDLVFAAACVDGD